ncbi:MAG: hypothetical protein ACRDL7_14985, partial [Gaiellaceae bacterium]
SVKCFKALSDYETQNVYHRKTFDLVGLESSKVTHLNRGVMQRDMNDFGLWSEIGRHVGYENSCQINNYCPNKPPQAVAFCAGAEDFASVLALKKFWPARTRIDAISDENMKMACPHIFTVSTPARKLNNQLCNIMFTQQIGRFIPQEMEKVASATAPLRTVKEKKQSCLITAKRNLEGLRDLIEAGILMGASRPKNAEGEFCGTMLCEMFRQHPVFMLEVWSQPWFVELALKVRRAEEEETLERSVGKSWSENDMKTYIDQKFKKMEQMFMESRCSIHDVNPPPIVSPVVPAMAVAHNGGASDVLVTPDVPMQIQDNTAQENSRKEAGGDGVWVAGTSVRKKRRP